MIAVKNSIVIDRPVNEVYDYLRNHDNRMFWQPNLVSHEHESRDSGARVTEIRNVLGRRVEIEGEFTASEENRSLTFRGQGPHVKRLEYRYRLSPEGDGTRLDTEMELQLAEPFELANPVIQRMSDREIDNAAKLLKDVLEVTHAEQAARQLPQHQHHQKAAPR